jgi:hypothetical protein
MTETDVIVSGIGVTIGIQDHFNHNKLGMSKMKQMLLATAAMCAVAQGYNPYAGKREERMAFNPDYKVKTSVKKLREFTIKGNKVMAYSKKDAIKRLKHR